MYNSSVDATWKRAGTKWSGPTQCEGCGIRKLVLFSALKDEDYALIHENIDEQRLDKGEVLYRSGGRAGSIFTIREGIVKLTHYTPDGDERIVRLLKRGDVAGLEALVGHKYQHTAVVIDAVLVCRLPLATIIKLDQRLPHFQQELLRRWQESVTEANGWLTELRTGPVRSRLARMLIRFAEHGSSADIYIPSLGDIGAMVAAKPESVSRILAEFKREGLVSKVELHRFSLDIDRLDAVDD